MEFAQPFDTGNRRWDVAIHEIVTQSINIGFEFKIFEMLYLPK